MSDRNFRFGLQLRPDGADAVAQAQRAEQAGFDIVTIPDHVGTDMVSPMVLLGAVGQATESIRLGTFVHQSVGGRTQAASRRVGRDHPSASRR